MKKTKVVLWDFDGTLAHRNGFFSEVLLEILDEYEEVHYYKIDEIRSFLMDGFPWHHPEHQHFELNNDAKAWWDLVEKVFIRAYEGIGLDNERAMKYAKLAHFRYIDSKRFVLYEDTEEVLKHFVNLGWENIILSNHVPELSTIVKKLGLDPYIQDCISSANVGYEKPNPEIFRLALRKTGHPDEVWMVGDNYQADIKGAESMGIDAILVRNEFREDAKHYAKNLWGVVQIIIK